MSKPVRRGSAPEAAFGLGIFVAGLGVVRTGIGILAWRAIRSQLAAERIVVPDSAQRLAGRPVKGPFTAFVEATTVKDSSLQATGGRTYGEMPEEDPLARMALDASLIRSSLYTSMVAFGEAAGEIGNGLATAAVGVAVALFSRDGTVSRPPTSA